MKPAQPGTTTNDPTRLTPAFVDQLGNRYEVISKLGSGAFGDVYRAKDTMLGRDVAVKRIRIDAFEDGQRDEIRKRSIREAQLAAALNHPKIVTMHDVVDCPDAIFIVMEYVDGETLREILNKKARLSLAETIEILSQAAEALDFAHGQKIVHRDVKPGNIMVRADGGVKMMDFGIAKSEASGNLTAVGAILGTPNYMSPEQAEGLSTVDPRSDLFSLGSIAFECLSGEKAFRAESVVGTLLRVVKGDTPKLDCDAVHLHPDAGKVMTRALAKDPAERFASAAEFIQMLRDVPEHEADPAPELPSQPVITRREPGTASSFDLDLQGDLQDEPLAKAIREIYTKRKTGILHVDSESVGRRLYFRKGSIVFANSDREQDRLGEFLIAQGDIDRNVFDRASKVMRETGQRFGRTLVELRIMSEEQMQGAVLAQIEHIICALFSLSSGNYAFERMERPVEQDIVLDISTGDTILQNIRDTVSADVVRKELGDLSAVLRHAENPLLLYQKISLDPSEGFVLSRVDEVSSIAELASVSPLGEEQTLKCIYALVSAGVLELEDSDTSRPTRRSERKVSLPEPEVVVGASQSETSPSAPPKPEKEAETTAKDKATLDDIATKHASLATANHYELLEIDRDATASGIKAAYYKMVKQYHPDRHHSVNLKEAQGLLEELFVKISAAYEVLSVASERAAYDGTVLRPKQESEEPTSRTPALAREEPHRDINPKVLAHEQYDAARRSFDNMAYHDAIQFLREAVRLDSTEPAYHKLLAIALSKNPHWTKEAEQSYRDALELNPTDVECYLGLAEIYEAGGMTTRAQKMYRKVLDYDPANETAFERLQDENPKSQSKVDRLKSALTRR